MPARALLVATVLACAALTACGGGERQDADEPAGEHALDVTHASFPAEQRLGGQATMVIEVRNAGDETAPAVAATIETQAGTGQSAVAFGQRLTDPALADPARPVWIVDGEPRGGATAYANTWALGALRPGQARRFEWRVTAVRAGSYTIRYRVWPGLDGNATLADDSGSAMGSFAVFVDDAPVTARVGGGGQVRRDE